MENIKIVFLIITGVLTIIGACLPWWTVSDLILEVEITVNFNPIYGVSEIPAPLLSMVIGIIALIGCVLLFTTLKTRNFGTIGGFLAIIGVILFILVFYIDDIGLGYGWYLTLLGAVMGVIASRILKRDVV